MDEGDRQVWSPWAVQAMGLAADSLNNYLALACMRGAHDYSSISSVLLGQQDWEEWKEEETVLGLGAFLQSWSTRRKDVN